MECNEIRKLLSNFIEDDLSVQLKEQIQKHLSDCKDCMAQLESMKRMVSELSKLKKVAAPYDMLEGIRRRLGIEPKKRESLIPWKLPLEAAGVLVSIILIVLFINQAGLFKQGKQIGTQMAIAPVPLVSEAPVRPGEARQAPLGAEYKVSEKPTETLDFGTAYEKEDLGLADYAVKSIVASRVVQEAPIEEEVISENTAQNIAKVKNIVRDLDGEIEKEESRKLYLKIPAQKLSNLFVWLKGLSAVMSTEPEFKEGSAYLAIEFFEGP